MKIDFSQNDFIAREKELAYLLERFEHSGEGHTNLVVIEADTGVGKTRLIQEFYQSLKVSKDEFHYWPDTLLDKKHTMSIVPEFEHLSNNQQFQMPWLWLALRCHNQDERNSTQDNSALSQIRKQIRLHLGGLIESQKKAAKNIQAIKSTLTLLANYAFPGSGAAVNLISGIVNSLDQGIGTVDSLKSLWSWVKREKEEDRGALIARQEYQSLVDQSLDIFSVIFETRNTPLVLVIDDAQWADSLTLEFLSKLIEKGCSDNWPLMIVCTCWESSYKFQIQHKGNEFDNFGQFCLSIKRNVSEDFVKLIKLERLNTREIIDVIGKELPHISTNAKSILAQNCSGDLEILWDFVRRIKYTPGYLDANGNLKVSFEKLTFKSFKKKELVRERILELGFAVSCLLACGSSQGIRFSRSFLEKCLVALNEDFNIDIATFIELDNPYNFTVNNEHPTYLEVAEFRRRIYYEVAKEILDEMPQRDLIHTLLLDYYMVLIQSRKLDSFEIYEQISIMEEFMHLFENLGENREGHRQVYIESGIKLIELCLHEGMFNKCKQYGEALLIKRVDFSGAQYKLILGILIEAAYGDGDIVAEEKYIELYSNFCVEFHENMDPENYLYQSKYQLRCLDSQKAIKLSQQAVSMIQDSPLDYLSYKCYEQLVKSYFYAGENTLGFTLLNEMETKFFDFLNEHVRIRISFDHTIALLCHNVDANIKVVEKSTTAKEGYFNLHDNYNYLLSRVNLADGYMGSGQLEMAETEIKAAYEIARESSWKHAHNIAAVCYGNILLTQGRLSEAFDLYEEGIAISKEIKHNWDLIYAQIWRSLCLAQFGDPAAYDNLYELVNRANEHNYDYLAALSSSFGLITGKLFSKEEHSAFFLKKLDKKLTPGLYAQGLASYIIQRTHQEDRTKKRLISELLDVVLKCEGIKGDGQIIVEAIDVNLHMIDDPEQILQYQVWVKDYIEPIRQYKSSAAKNLERKFDSQVRIKSCSLNCEAMCCYDGVYLNKGEEDMLKNTVSVYPQYFSHLPTEFIVDGNWRNELVGRKTATRSHQYTNRDFPSHFNQTRCVFANDAGLCSLQTAATENDMHPWKFKPLACWVFPMSMENGHISGPPAQDQIDPDYIDETYPGYTKYVTCGTHDDNGKVWYEKYYHEISKIETIMKNKK